MSKEPSIVSWAECPAVLKTPQWKPLFVFRKTIASITDVGDTPNGKRQVVVASGGLFDGDIPGLSGTIHAGGTDWVTERSDTARNLDARVTLETKDGDLIMLTYQGLRYNPPEIRAQIATGDIMSPEDYYLRVAIRFETASKPFDWLNHTIAFGIGQRFPVGVRYAVFGLL